MIVPDAAVRWEREEAARREAERDAEARRAWRATMSDRDWGDQ